MFGSRVLSLFALLIALVAVEGAISHLPASSDRAELSQQGDGWDGEGDGTDLTLPPRTIALPTLPNAAGPSIVEAERTPATSPFQAPIFRPPISALA